MVLLVCRFKKGELPKGEGVGMGTERELEEKMRRTKLCIKVIRNYSGG